MVGYLMVDVGLRLKNSPPACSRCQRFGTPPGISAAGSSSEQVVTIRLPATAVHPLSGKPESLTPGYSAQGIRNQGVGWETYHGSARLSSESIVKDAGIVAKESEIFLIQSHQAGDNPRQS